jgi:hypothetical protein
VYALPGFNEQRYALLGFDGQPATTAGTHRTRSVFMLAHSAGRGPDSWLSFKYLIICTAQHSTRHSTAHAWHSGCMAQHTAKTVRQSACRQLHVAVPSQLLQQCLLSSTALTPLARFTSQTCQCCWGVQDVKLETHRCVSFVVAAQSAGSVPRRLFPPRYLQQQMTYTQPVDVAWSHIMKRRTKVWKSCYCL